MSGSDKIGNRNTYVISSIKRVTRKFHLVVAKQRQSNVQKNVLHMQSRGCYYFFFFANIKPQ